MKQLILSIFVLTGNFLFSQNYYTISFEGTGLYENDSRHELYLDSISNPNNIWQIGEPQKSIFTSAYTLPNVIVTDTMNSYPINDTSSFIIKHVADAGFCMPNYVALGGMYFVNSDTITDYGKIEFSPDNGGSWIDLSDPNYSDYIDWHEPYLFFGNPPVFSGNSNGWNRFRVNLEQLGPFFNIDCDEDTVQFRFSFISDGIQTNKDGLMFDSLFVEDVPPVGLQNISGDELSISVSPNPVSTSVNIELNATFTEISKLVIFDNIGRPVKEIEISDNEKTFSLNIEDLPNGMYTICLQNNNGYLLSSKSIIKSK